MIQRCYNPNYIRSERYMKRGIRVCDRWRESFDNFMEDMGKRPTKDHSLDRINNDGNYEPSNCKWSTNFEQSANSGRYLESKNLYPSVYHETLKDGRSKYFVKSKTKKYTHREAFDSLEEAISMKLFLMYGL